MKEKLDLFVDTFFSAVGRLSLIVIGGIVGLIVGMTIALNISQVNPEIVNYPVRDVIAQIREAFNPIFESIIIMMMFAVAIIIAALRVAISFIPPLFRRRRANAEAEDG